MPLGFDSSRDRARTSRITARITYSIASLIERHNAALCWADRDEKPAARDGLEKAIAKQQARGQAQRGSGVGRPAAQPRGDRQDRGGVRPSRR